MSERIEKDRDFDPEEGCTPDQDRILEKREADLSRIREAYDKIQDADSCVRDLFRDDIINEDLNLVITYYLYRASEKLEKYL